MPMMHNTEANRRNPPITQNAQTARLMTAGRRGARRHRPQALWKTARGCFAKIIFPGNAKLGSILSARLDFSRRKIRPKYPAFRENNPPCNPPVRPLQEAPQFREPAHERIARPLGLDAFAPHFARPVAGAA